MLDYMNTILRQIGGMAEHSFDYIMIDITKAEIESICMHYIGNKNREEGIKVSSHPLSIDLSLEEILVKYFLSPFKQNEFYSFYHETSLKFNEVYNYIFEIFNNNESIFEQSINLAKHLYKQSSHPQIKNGEFYVVNFRNCILNNEIVDAIGLFKSENKDTFLKISPKNEDFEIKSEEGININKLDKGCLIFNIERENGYLINVVDNTNKSIGAQAQYWIDNFLQIKRYNDSYFQTQQMLDLCKRFADEEFPLNDSVSKINQADFLTKSISFLKDNSHFNYEEFGEKVFQGTKIANSFQEYKEQYETSNQTQLLDEFDISNTAVKKQSKAYQSLIKLDNNFHIYVHGDTSLIQNGVDDDTGMKFYRFLYDEER